MPRVSFKEVTKKRNNDITADIKKAQALQKEYKGCAYSLKLFKAVKEQRDLGLSHEDISRNLEIAKDTVSKVCTWLNKTTLDTPEIKELMVDAAKEILTSEYITTEKGIVSNNRTRAKMVMAGLMPKKEENRNPPPAPININFNSHKVPLEVNPEFEFKELKEY